MIFSQIYATILLPGILGWTALWFAARAELDDTLALGFATASFLCAMAIGYEAEHHYFREVCEGKGRLTRFLIFLPSLPTIYAVSILSATAAKALVPAFPL